MKNKVFTIPNSLSFFRLLLIPAIIWSFLSRQDNYTATALILLSCVTDVVDGYIARRFDMISNLGKILDPCADKLTQVSILICIAVKLAPMRFLLGLMAAKELILGIVGLITVKRTAVVTGSFWHGKASTVVLYFVILAHMLFINMPDALSLVLISLSACMMILSLVLYIRKDLSIIEDHGSEQPNE